MKTIQITAKETTANTVNGMSYHFSRSNIDYTIFVKRDCVDVWKQNNQRRSISTDCFWNGVNNQGRPMAQFLKTAMNLIAA